MARPRKAERSRRQGLARERRLQEESQRDQDEKAQEAADAASYEADMAEAYDAIQAAEDERIERDYEKGLPEAMDALAGLVADAQEQGDGVVDVGTLIDLLREFKHPGYRPDGSESGWCGTGL